MWLAQNRYLLSIVGCIKILLLIFFTSDYNASLFRPFVDIFVSRDLNPWQFYFENGLNSDAFPYHPLMLYIFYITSLISKFLNASFLFNIPLFIADCIIFYILMRLFPHKQKQVIIFYFINPIILYSTYIHSQLDIVPTAILLSSIYLLIKHKIALSAIVFGLSVATKMHIVIAFPLILFFVNKEFGKYAAYKFIYLFVICFLCFDLPFMFSEGFINMVLMNQRQLSVYDTFYTIGDAKLFLPVSAVLAVYFHCFNQNKINNDLLFFYLGFLFTSIMLFIYSGPAWYVWSIPFVSIYFIQAKNQNKSVALYSMISVSYIVFFIFFYKSPYNDIIFSGDVVNIKIHNNTMHNLSFTILEIVMLSIVYSFYKYGIKSNSIYKKQTNLSIGIGGDSGTGKSTLISSLFGLLGKKLLQIEGDGEHKWERGDKNWNDFTHLDPRANHIYKQFDIIYNLKHNNSVFRREYDHNTGKFTEPKKIMPAEFIVIAGLHPFYLPKARKSIDLKVYMDTDDELRRHWKIIRDIDNRGYNIQSILKQINDRAVDAEKYIYPQRKFADIIINFYPVEQFEVGDKDAKVNIGLKIIFDANIQINDILDRLNCDFIWDYNDDLNSQYVEFRSPPHSNFEFIANETIDNLDEIIIQDAKWLSGYDGFIQLLIIKMISEKLKDQTI